MFAESLNQVDMVLAHDIINAKCIFDSIHICGFECLGQAVVLAHLPFTQFKIDHTAGTKAAMSGTCLSSDSSCSPPQGYFFSILLGFVCMAGRFLLVNS